MCREDFLYAVGVDEALPLVFNHLEDSPAYWRLFNTSFIVVSYWLFLRGRFRPLGLECPYINCSGCVEIRLLCDPEVTANLYCDFAYWEGCVIFSIYLR